jgi:hypothetical protein
MRAPEAKRRAREVGWEYLHIEAVPPTLRQCVAAKVRAADGGVC